MNKPLIITFSGKAQHGKDSSADILKRLLESRGKRVLKVNYADYLKYLAKQYLGWNGEKDEKGRTLLQQLGTEKVRHKFPDFWVDAVIGIAQVFEDDVDYVLIGDCRFPNEINKWIEEGYQVIPVHVERINFDNGLTEEQKNHRSETSLNAYPFPINISAESMTDLENEIIKHMEGLLN